MRRVHREECLKCLSNRHFIVGASLLHPQSLGTNCLSISRAGSATSCSSLVVRRLRTPSLQRCIPASLAWMSLASCSQRCGQEHRVRKISTGGPMHARCQGSCQDSLGRRGRVLHPSLWPHLRGRATIPELINSVEPALLPHHYLLSHTPILVLVELFHYTVCFP